MLVAFDTDGRYTLFVLAALLHEGGHAISMTVCGKTIDKITLLPAGLDLQYHGGRASYLNDIVIALAGPLANCFAAFLFSRGEGAMYDYFVGVNLALCFFNLIPIHPLDGGRMTQLSLECFLGPDKGLRIFASVSLLISILLFVTVTLSFAPKGNLWPILVFGYLLLCQIPMIKNSCLLPCDGL